MNRVRVLRLSCPGKVKKHPTANPSDSCQIFSKRFTYLLTIILAQKVYFQACELFSVMNSKSVSVLANP